MVKFDGLGIAPSGFENVGHCTQIAIFIRSSDEINTSQNKFEFYLKNKKQSYLKNREIQLKSSSCITKINQEAYFLSESFHGSDFKMIHSVLYPFESFDFETEIDRQHALLREIDSITRFLTASHRGFGPCSSDRVMSEEQNEKLKNNIDLDNENIRLVSLNKLFEFSNLKKFKYTNEKLFEIMKENNYEFSQSLKFIIYRIIDEPYDDSNDESDDCYLESNNTSQFHEEEEEEWA